MQHSVRSLSGLPAPLCLSVEKRYLTALLSVLQRCREDSNAQVASHTGGGEPPAQQDHNNHKIHRGRSRTTWTGPPEPQGPGGGRITNTARCQRGGSENRQHSKTTTTTGSAGERGYHTMRRVGGGGGGSNPGSCTAYSPYQAETLNPYQA